MACNCRGGAATPGATYEVVLRDGTVTDGYTSEIQAKIAAAKLGGTVRVKEPAPAA